MQCTRCKCELSELDAYKLGEVIVCEHCYFVLDVTAHMVKSEDMEPVEDDACAEGLSEK